MRTKAWRSKKLRVGSLPSFSIPELVKMHKANPANTFSFKDIKLVVDGTFIHLESLGTEKLIFDKIKIASMACHYGGERYFAHCPFCQTRVMRLYLHSADFACRHCYKMSYTSQHQSTRIRLILKRSVIGKKINDDNGQKPKWMRNKTFALLRRQYSDLDEKELIAEFFSLRSNRAAEKILAEYGSALTAAEMWEMKRGGYCHERLIPFYDIFLQEHRREMALWQARC